MVVQNMEIKAAVCACAQTTSIAGTHCETQGDDLACGIMGYIDAYHVQSPRK